MDDLFRDLDRLLGRYVRDDAQDHAPPEDVFADQSNLYVIKSTRDTFKRLIESCRNYERAGRAADKTENWRKKTAFSCSRYSGSILLLKGWLQSPANFRHPSLRIWTAWYICC